MTDTHNHNHLHGKVALVTGAAKRVGRAIALAYARAGMDVAITYHTSAAKAQATCRDIEQLGRRCMAVQVNMLNADAPQRVFDAVSEAFDRLDVLVNNASSFNAMPLARITTDEFERQMTVNARAPLMLIQQFAPLLGAHYDPRDVTSLGRIINFIDIHVMGEPLKGYLAYNASKAALMEITMSAAMELAPKITVNALAPGVVAWADEYTEQMKRAYMTRVPLARPGTPEDAAAAALFLARDAHYCTGQIIKLDGGRLLT